MCDLHCPHFPEESTLNVDYIYTTHVKKYVNIPSEKYFYVHIYMCVYVYIHTYVKWMSTGLMVACHKNG